MNATSYFGYRTIGIVHSSSHIVIGLHSTQNFGFWVVFFSNFDFFFRFYIPRFTYGREQPENLNFGYRTTISSPIAHQLRSPYSYHHSTIGSAPFWALLRQRAAIYTVRVARTRAHRDFSWGQSGDKEQNSSTHEVF